MAPQSDGDTPLAEPSFHDSDLSWDDSASPDAPPASDTSSSAPAPEITPAAATVQPGQTQTPEAGTAPQGPIPFERHQAILNAQREEAERRWQRVAWADDLLQAGATPDEVREARELYQRTRGNPEAFIEELLQTAGKNPQIAQAVRSIAVRALGMQNGNGHEAGADDAEPQADYYTTDANGNKTPFMSAAQHQKWAEWYSRKQDAKLQPLLNEREERQQAAAKQEEQRQALGRVTRDVTELRKNPLFVKHEADVTALLKAHDYRMPLHRAWLQVLETKILPNLSQTERAKTVADLQTKAAASGIKPGAATASTPKDPTSFKDPSLIWK